MVMNAGPPRYSGSGEIEVRKFCDRLVDVLDGTPAEQEDEGDLPGLRESPDAINAGPQPACHQLGKRGDVSGPAVLGQELAQPPRTGGELGEALGRDDGPGMQRRHENAV